MANLIALIDIGGTFTKLATLDAASGQFVTRNKYPSEMLWLRKDLARNRISSELQACRLGAPPKPEIEDSDLRDYERVYVSFPGKVRPGTTLVDLAYVKKWQNQWQEKQKRKLPRAAIWPDFVDLPIVLGIERNRVAVAVDKVVSGIEYLNRNPTRDGAILTLGTGVGLVRITDGRIFEDVTARTILVDSKLSAIQKNLHDFIGGSHVNEIAGGTAKDIRKALSFRLTRALLAIESALIKAVGNREYLIEIAGGGALLYDSRSVLREFESGRKSGAEISFLSDSDFNNIHGLAFLYRAGKTAKDFVAEPP